MESKAQKEESRKWSNQFIPHFNTFYHSQNFFNICNKMTKRGKLIINRIDRSENYLFQTNTHFDVIITFVGGKHLLIDEKVMEYKDGYDKDLFAVEVNNPQHELHKEGWGYFNGTTIVAAWAKNHNPKDGFISEPFIYNISEKFINEITRNSKYKIIIARSSGTVNKLVPIDILKTYFP